LGDVPFRRERQGPQIALRAGGEFAKDEEPAIPREVVRILRIRPFGDLLFPIRSPGVLAKQPQCGGSEQDRSAVMRPYRQNVKSRCRCEPAGQAAALQVQEPEIVAARSVTSCHNAAPVRRKAKWKAVHGYASEVLQN